MENIKKLPEKGGENPVSKLRDNLSLKIMVLIILLSLTTPSYAATSWAGIVDQVSAILNQAHTAYQAGKVNEAKNLVNDAYYGPFESGQMEKAVKFKISAKRVADLEERFRLIRKQMTSGASSKEVKASMDELVAMLREDAARLDGSTAGGYGMFVSSFLIIVREGFEAILILGAIIAYLIKSGNRDKVKTIYYSAVWAVAASFLTALALKFVFRVSGASQEILEGVTMLIAVAVLFSVSFWLISKVEAKKWQNYIEGKIKTSITTGSAMALWFTAFLAVYREGAETVLFYQALLSGTGSSSPGMLGLGFLAGCLVLVVIFAAIRYGSVKVPIKPFFIATSTLLYYMALVFAGQGVKELQEGGVIGVTPVDLPTIGLIGFYPTWETLTGQLMILAAAVAGFAYQALKGRSKTAGNLRG